MIEFRMETKVQVDCGLGGCEENPKWEEYWVALETDGKVHCPRCGLLVNEVHFVELLIPTVVIESPFG